MPRRHRRDEPERGSWPISAGHQVEDHPDGTWAVRRLTGASPVSGAKAYRCPGCQQEIAAGTAHVVAWPADSDGSDRRHWHTGCWAARVHRHPPGSRRRA